MLNSIALVTHQSLFDVTEVISREKNLKNN